jgi:hypothetical protein
MKNCVFVFLLFSAVLTSCSGRSGNNSVNSVTGVSDTGTARIVFKDYEHQFGNVTEGEKIGYIFTYENNGTSDLIIKSASPSCGCTVPKFDKKPVRPGESGKIEVVFDTSGRRGLQTKTISVSSNASTPVVLLKITAEVVAEKNN